MLHSTCPSERLNGTTGIAPRTLEDLMKRCTLLKPKLDSHYFREIGDNPFHSLFRGTNQEIILTKYAHGSSSLSSLYQPPPSAHTGLSTQLLSPDETELWDGDAPGTQIESPLLSVGPPHSEDTPTAEESQSVRDKYRSLLLLMSSDSEQSDGDTAGLVFTETQEDLQQIQECEDGVRESLTQAFSLNESIYNIEKSPPRTDEQIIKLPDCQQTQDSDSFFASLDTILFQYTEQIQSQTQTKTSPIIIQDESPLVSVGPSVSIYSREMIESQTHTNTDEYSSEYEYSGSESDSDLLMISSAESESQSININGISPHHSANSNLITGGNMTDPHTEYNANRASPDFKPKRIKLTITTPDDKWSQTPRKGNQHINQRRLTDVFRKPDPVRSKPWTKQEEKLLVIGVSKFGKKWKKIHADLNFSPSRNAKGLARKYQSLSLNGKYSKYLSEFHKKSGYKSHDPSAREPYSNKVDQANEQRTQTAAHLVPEKWTNQEMENLVIGVERYGSDWERIHSSFNFSLSLSYHSLYKKYCKMKKCGDYNKTLLSYGKKIARTIPAASQATQNDKLRTCDKTSSDISGEITAFNSFHNKFPKRATSKRRSTEEVSEINDSNYWTRNEVNNLVRGHEQHGNNWSVILEKYTFNPCRTSRSLSRKLNKMSKESGDSFFNDNHDPYFLPS